MSVVIEVKHLSKKFRHWVLKDLNFQIHSGECVALVGANGAGKSTLMKILLNLVSPTQGSIEVGGWDVSDPRARQKLGYLPESPAYWPELNVFEYLEATARLRNMDMQVALPRISQLLSAVGLLKRGSRLMGTYSKGMLQRSVIAQMLLTQPDLFILDEPMSGLDPRAQEKLRLILQELKAKGKTMLISSHSLEDIHRLCDRVLVIEQTRLIEDGPTSAVLEKLVEKYRSSEPWDEDPAGDFKDAL